MDLQIKRVMQFKDIIDDERILRNLEKLGFLEPTPIQKEAIQQIMKGGDLRASAQTGTGKSAAFLLPVLMRLAKAKDRRGPRALILVPTRELAIQLAAEAAKLGNSLNLITVSIYGGVPYPPQFRQLSKPHDILIATPGRLMDHMEQKRIQLGQIEMFVLDEADRMLDMGFIKPVEEIASKMPASKQTLMFSATFDKNVRKLSLTLLKDPFEITSETTPANQARIQQEFIRTDDLAEKQRRLEELLTQPNVDQVIVFSSTKIQSEKIAKKLRDAGLQAGALHGDMHQRQRTRTLDALRSGRLRILVATDVAGRGIDVLTISHVINFDLPRNVEDYIHRIGRTGRAGNTGMAYSFFSNRDIAVKREIEKKFGMKTSSEPAPAAPQKKHKKKQFWKQKRSFPRTFRRN